MSDGSIQCVKTHDGVQLVRRGVCLFAIQTVWCHMQFTCNIIAVGYDRTARR
jgi:hypothetical protein